MVCEVLEKEGDVMVILYWKKRNIGENNCVRILCLDYVGGLYFNLYVSYNMFIFL